jgi:hypothetical protein
MNVKRLKQQYDPVKMMADIRINCSVPVLAQSVKTPYDRDN